MTTVLPGDTDTIAGFDDVGVGDDVVNSGVEVICLPVGDPPPLLVGGGLFEVGGGELPSPEDEGGGGGGGELPPPEEAGGEDGGGELPRSEDEGGGACGGGLSPAPDDEAPFPAGGFEFEGAGGELAGGGAEPDACRRTGIVTVTPGAVDVERIVVTIVCVETTSLVPNSVRVATG